MAPSAARPTHPCAAGLARLLARVLPVLLLLACSAPEHFTRLWPEGTSGEPLVGLSTEEGVLLLAQPQWVVGDLFEIQFPVGNSLVRDWGRLDRRDDDLAVVLPISSRILEGRLASVLPSPEETIWLALRDDDDDPVMHAVSAWKDGRYGNWIEPPVGDAASLARRWAGAGLYVHRDGRWEIVGLLSDVTARLPGDPPSEAAIGVIDLIEISRILPDQVDYFAHPILPPRPDFEFGVPLQQGDIVLPDEVEPTDPGPAPDPGGEHGAGS